MGAGDVGAYDGATSAGLQTTAQALQHIAGDIPLPASAELGFNDPSNLDRSAVWVRGSLYVSEFLHAMAWAADDTTKQVSLSFDGTPVITLVRPDEQLLRDQCRLVRNYADLRPDRTAEIMSQLGFPTPYFSMILGLHGGQHSKTFELITMTQTLAAHAAMVVKHALALRRPDQLDGAITPIIPTPGHGSFPSAHATESYAVMTVLSALVQHWDSLSDMDVRVAMLRGLAERVAVNRTVAGVHYPIDSWAGAALGVSVGRVILNRCGVVTPTPALHYQAQNSDFFDADFADDTIAQSQGLTHGADVALSPSDTFTWLWTRATAEAQKA